MTIFNRLTKLLQANSAILALGLIGSHQRGTADQWSDWDAVIVADYETTVTTFFDDLGWAEPLGQIFAHSQSQTEFTRTLRLCFADFQRLDLVFTTPSALAKIQYWSSIPFAKGVELVFAQTDYLAQILTAYYPPSAFASFPLENLNQLGNDFFFKAQLAIFKIMRDDRLIALHLTLDLLREVSVLAMLIRDEKEQTTHHATGGWGNSVVDHELPILASYQSNELLAHIDELGHLFDRYARQLHGNYQGKADILRTIIQKAQMN